MPKTFDEIVTSYNSGNIMDWTNSINRLNGIPLDPTSIYKTYSDAVIYAATNPVAYVGQLITAADTLYIITNTAHGTIIVDGVSYTVYLKEVQSSFDRLVVDGGNAAQAEAEVDS